MTCAFVSDYKIDSYLKLRVLLALHEHPQQSLSLDELCEQFFVADRHALEHWWVSSVSKGCWTATAHAGLAAANRLSPIAWPAWSARLTIRWPASDC